MAGVDQDIQRTDVSFKEFLTQLHQLKTLVFSGSLSVEIGNTQWTLFLRLGRISGQAGGVRPHERWRRHLALFCSNITASKLEQIASEQDPHQQYIILAQLLGQGLVQRQKLADFMSSAMTEVLFDVIQSCNINGDRLSYKLTQDNPNSKLGLLLPLVEIELAVEKATSAWQKWQSAGLAAYSPNLFPVIQKPDLLQKQTSASAYQQLISLIHGTQTLRILALKSHQDLISLSQALLPLVESEALAFSEVPTPRKFDPPVIDPVPSYRGNNPVVTPSEKQPLVACIDDSPTVSQVLEKILKEHGYRFIGIQDSLKALPLLLKSKPDLIFLDLLMPVTNGYEVCTQIRKAPSLKDVPVVILTGRDGLVDRMRAKLVGSTDFLSKPVEAEQVLKILNKYLTVGE